jgi:hypothetical protein
MTRLLFLEIWCLGCLGAYLLTKERVWGKITQHNPELEQFRFVYTQAADLAILTAYFLLWPLITIKVLLGLCADWR